MPARRVIWVALGGGALVAATLAATGCFHVDHPYWDDRWYYDACYDDWQCPYDAACYAVTIDYPDARVTDSLCTHTCVWDSDCPDWGVCQRPGAGPKLCFRPCHDDYDCPGGFACVEDAHHVASCLPW